MFELNRTWHRINSKTDSNKKGAFYFLIYENKGNTNALLRTHYCEYLLSKTQQVANTVLMPPYVSSICAVGDTVVQFR